MAMLIFTLNTLKKQADMLLAPLEFYECNKKFLPGFLKKNPQCIFMQDKTSNPSNDWVFNTLPQLLQQLNRPLNNICKVIVCAGPGSFTGIRLGISMAQALKLAQGIKLIAFDKFLLLKFLFEQQFSSQFKFLHPSPLIINILNVKQSFYSKTLMLQNFKTYGVKKINFTHNFTPVEDLTKIPQEDYVVFDNKIFTINLDSRDFFMVQALPFLHIKPVKPLYYYNLQYIKNYNQ